MGCTRSRLAAFLLTGLVVSSTVVGLVALPSAALAPSVAEAHASDVVFTDADTAGEQAFVVTIEDVTLTEADTLTIDPGTAAPAYMNASVEATASSGPNASAVTPVTTVTDTGRIQLTVTSLNETITEVTITVTASELETATLQPGRLTGVRIGEETIDDVFALSEPQTVHHSDNQIVYTGQRLQVDNSTTLATGAPIAESGDGMADITALEIRRVNDDREIGGLETRGSVTRTSSGQRYLTVDTTSLDGTGEYALVYRGLSGTPATRGDPIADRATNASLIELSREDFDASFETNDVLDSETTDVQLDSTRSEYIVSVTADGLSDDEIAQIFAANDQPATAAALPAQFTSDSDATILKGQDPLTANFTGITPDTYDIRFNVTDTNRTATTTITISETVVDARWDEPLYRTSAGDLATLTLELDSTDDAYVQLGGPDVGFLDILYVEDDSGDDQIELIINTRLLGAAGVSTDAVYHAEGDTVESGFHGEFTEGAPAFQTNSTTTTNYQAYVAALGVFESDTPRLDRPVQPGEYPLVVGETPTLRIDDGAPEFESELTRGFLELTPPTLQNVTTRTAPAGAADAYTGAASARRAGSPQSTVRDGDRLILEFNATGLYGHLAAIHGDSGLDLDAFERGEAAAMLATLRERRGEGITLDIESVPTSPNDTPVTLNLDAPSEIISLYPAPEQGTLVVVIDTRSNRAFDGSLDDATAFTATLSYDTSTEDPFEFAGGDYQGGASGDPNEPAYPYPARRPDPSITTTFNISDPTVTFPTTNNGTVALLTESEYTLRGDTNLAPGTEVGISIRSTQATDVPFFKRVETRVEANGSVQATFDLTDQTVGEPATITLFTDTDGRIASLDATFVESLGASSEQLPLNITAPDTTPPGEQLRITARGTQTESLRIQSVPARWTVTSVDTNGTSPPRLTITLTAPEQPTTGTFTIAAGTDIIQTINVTVTEVSDMAPTSAAPAPQLSVAVHQASPSPTIEGQVAVAPRPDVQAQVTAAPTGLVHTSRLRLSTQGWVPAVLSALLVLVWGGIVAWRYLQQKSAHS